MSTTILTSCGKTQNADEEHSEHPANEEEHPAGEEEHPTNESDTTQVEQQ